MGRRHPRTLSREVTDLLAEAATRPVRGWDFSWLGDRISIEPPAWDFEAIVLRRARRSPDLLDLGTGGGEWLAALSFRPPRTVATEGFAPNVEVAGARLRPLGVTVVQIEGAPDNVDQRADDIGGRLPFPSASFALVVSRHEAFVAAEVARVLTAGGAFLTEQVGSDWRDFHDLLGLQRPAARRLTLALLREQLHGAGLRTIAAGEGTEVTRFGDVGAFAWYLRAVPWAVRGFTIDRHRAALERVHDRIRAGGVVAVRQPALWLEAEKR
jgi:SAM-dependent methyltransferase